MLLSVITINRNNSKGLQYTMQSIVGQGFKDFEYIVVDGASTDNSVDIIKLFEPDSRLHWISEPDKGIYNAMNKGIRMAQGDYVVMINSGDALIHSNVLERMSDQLRLKGNPDILYGNIIKRWPNGRTLRDPQFTDGNITMFNFYTGTINHVGTFARRALFTTVGYYDEDMKICSDWAWFLNSIALHGAKVSHCDIDTVFFDMTGVSESDGKHAGLIRQERRQVLEATLPQGILADYDRYASDIRVCRRLHRHPVAWRLVRLIERLLFKWERLTRKTSY